MWGDKGAEKVNTLKLGPYTKESIPANRGRPTVAEQRKVDELMERNGRHTCGAKNPGTENGNAVADHQPPQALDQPKSLLKNSPDKSHCPVCSTL